MNGIGLQSFADRYLLAREESIKTKPEGGLAGLELEWNLLDSQFHPLLTVGAGPDQESFVDYLRSVFISPRLRDFSQLEVFHWMIEMATQPYFSPRSAVYEARLLEGILINALSKAGNDFNERFYMWHGNLPYLTSVSTDSIPTSWHLAKRRYLEQCILLYGDSLATTGTHKNLSLPDALFEWEYMQLPSVNREASDGIPIHLDEFKSEFYITATRVMRAFASLFIAINASTPFKAGLKNGHPEVYLSKFDSNRNLIFPNPIDLDLPDLYKSLNSYLKISYDLVRRGIRFGNNNWTPTRARSFAEPVERLIDLTSEQLHDLYSRGLFVLGQDQSLDGMVQQIEMQNLLARINLPMARLEIRTDDGGNPMDIEIACLTLQHLLLLRIFSDKEFGAGFKYNQNDIASTRNNEVEAAKFGLRAKIQDPIRKKSISMREFLSWCIAEVYPMADLLDLAQDLSPLIVLAEGGPNIAERLRNEVCKELGTNPSELCEDMPVPLDLLQKIASAREDQVKKDIEYIAGNYQQFGEDSRKLGEMLQFCREDVHLDPVSLIRFRPNPQQMVETVYPDKTSEIISLAKKLIEIPSVTAGAEERREEVLRTATMIYDYLRDHSLETRYFGHSKYPAILAGFRADTAVPVMLSGHFDVVAPEPDDSQFRPYQEGDYLYGRGSADMKTVLATYLVWMKDQLSKGEPYPPVNLLLIGNEENGEAEPMGTPHVMEILAGEKCLPELFIAGERTGEKGNELWGEICIENRGVMRFEIAAKGEKEHTGVASSTRDLSSLLLEARGEIEKLMVESLTLASPDGWRSQVNFPFVQIGAPGVFNIRPGFGRIGVEIRTIPQDDLLNLCTKLQRYCDSMDLKLDICVMENGIACDLSNPYLKLLIEAVRNTSKSEPRLGKKLPGTSARFAPRGQGVVWGQSGLNPHGKDERHYIPSIMPYYQALCKFGELLRSK